MSLTESHTLDSGKKKRGKRNFNDNFKEKSKIVAACDFLVERLLQ